MKAFGGFGSMPGVEVDVLTDAYRISGTVRTRCGGVSEILNHQPGAFLTVEHATVSEHADPAIADPSTMAAVGSILVMAAPSLTEGSRAARGGQAPSLLTRRFPSWHRPLFRLMRRSG